MDKKIHFTQEERNEKVELLRLDIEKAKNGDNEALKNIFKSMDFIINNIVRNYYIENYTQEDLIQIAKISIYEGVKIFNKDKNKSPKTFLKICIERDIQDLVKYHLTDKRKISIGSYSLDAPINTGNDDKNTVYLKDTISDNYSIDRVMEKKEIKDLFEERIYPMMSKREKKCIQLNVEGYSPKDISKKLSITPKQVDNAMQKARKKIKENDYIKSLYFKQI